MTLKFFLDQVIIHTSGGGGGPIHYQTVVHSGSLSSVVGASGLVTTGGHAPSSLNSVVHSAALRLGKSITLALCWQLELWADVENVFMETVFLILLPYSSVVHAAALEAEQLNAVVQSGEKLHTLVHTGDDKLNTLVHTGDLDTVQLVHSYNLPPSAEKEQTVVEQLLFQASGLHQVVNTSSTKKLLIYV